MSYSRVAGGRPFGGGQVPPGHPSRVPGLGYVPGYSAATGTYPGGVDVVGVAERPGAGTWALRWSDIESGPPAALVGLPGRNLEAGMDVVSSPSGQPYAFRVGSRLEGLRLNARELHGLLQELPPSALAPDSRAALAASPWSGGTVPGYAAWLYQLQTTGRPAPGSLEPGWTVRVTAGAAAPPEPAPPSAEDIARNRACDFMMHQSAVSDYQRGRISGRELLEIARACEAAGGTLRPDIWNDRNIPGWQGTGRPIAETGTPQDVPCPPGWTRTGPGVCVGPEEEEWTSPCGPGEVWLDGECVPERTQCPPGWRSIGPGACEEIGGDGGGAPPWNPGPTDGDSPPSADPSVPVTAGGSGLLAALAALFLLAR